jgi:Fe2+ transport system protein B
LTGLRQNVAILLGAPVERWAGRARVQADCEVHFIDLPAIYSLTHQPEDDRVTLDVLNDAALPPVNRARRQGVPWIPRN